MIDSGIYFIVVVLEIFSFILHLFWRSFLFLWATFLWLRERLSGGGYLFVLCFLINYCHCIYIDNLD